MDRAGSEEADRIRGHLDVVRFRTLVTDAFEDGDHAPLQRFMKRFAGTTLTSTSCTIETGEKWWEIIVLGIAKSECQAEEWARKDLPRLLSDIGKCLTEIKNQQKAVSPFTLPEGANSPQPISPIRSPIRRSTEEVNHPLPEVLTLPEPLSPPKVEPTSKRSSSKNLPELSPVLSTDEDSDISLGDVARSIGRADPETSTPPSPTGSGCLLDSTLFETLSAYASGPFDNIEPALDCYIPGASICTGRVLEQMTEGELVLCEHLLETLTCATNDRLLRFFQEREALRGDIQHRHEYANMLYARANKTAFTSGLF